MAKRKLDIYKNWKREEVEVNSLHLDPKNVRLEIDEVSQSNIDQGSIINDLFTNERAFTILENIIENGWFIDELPIIVKEAGKSVVLEGNRRVAALKVIQNPNLVPNFSAKVQPLNAQVNPLKKITVLVAPNRASALSLLANKHTYVTRRPWKPLRQAYFYYSQLSQKNSTEDLIKRYKGVDIPSFIRMAEIHRVASSYSLGDPKTETKVRQQRTFPISTVERLYEDVGFRRHLGFDFDRNGFLKIKSSKKSFDKQFATVIRDAAEKNIDTRKLNSEDGRREYYTAKLSKLEEAGRATSSKTYKPKEPPKASRRKSIGLLSKTMVCTVGSPGIERVLAELQNIDYAKFPNASHDLLRSFIEAVLKEYLRKKGKSPSPRRSGGYVFLEDVLKATENHFKAEQNHQIRQIVSGLIKTKEELDCINHNPSIFSTGPKVKAAADQMSDLIEHIFEDMK